MISLESAVNRIANAEGWSREDILEAAKVLCTAVNSKMEIKLSSSVEPAERRQARDELIYRMSEGIGICLLVLRNLYPDYDPLDKTIHGISDAMNNFRKALDTTR